MMEVVTKAEPSEEQWDDLCFAWTVVRRVRSNAIVLGRDGATIGIGAGQMSRVDSVRLAVEKCRDARGDAADALLAGSVIASDAFFPFADGPELAIEAGATAVIQPGGSKRDAEVIEACDAAGRRDGLHQAPALQALGRSLRRSMKPVTVSIEVPQSPEEVFDYLDVLANHEAVHRPLPRRLGDVGPGARASGPGRGCGSRSPGPRIGWRWR